MGVNKHQLWSSCIRQSSNFLEEQHSCPAKPPVHQACPSWWCTPCYTWCTACVIPGVQGAHSEDGIWPACAARRRAAPGPAGGRRPRLPLSRRHFLPSEAAHQASMTADKLTWWAGSGRRNKWWLYNPYTYHRRKPRYPTYVVIVGSSITSQADDAQLAHVNNK